MQKLNPDTDGKNMDIVSDNIAKLRGLFPEAFTEGKIDFDILKETLGEFVDDRKERYSFTWNGKSKARMLAQTPSTGTLRPCPDESVNFDDTQNLFIEGDNLEVLKLLQKSYYSKIKMIYIDPPYNTGKDFIYPDSYKDNISNYLNLTGQTDGVGRKLSTNSEKSGRFHTSWLNMMYPRLLLARNLLSEKGVCLISIDDNEIENTKKICSEIFGEENFVACMVWEKSRKNDAKFVSVGHEYVVIYAKSLDKLKSAGISWREEKPGARDIWDKYSELRTLHGKDDSTVEEELGEWFSGLPKKHPSKKWARYKRVDANGPWRDRDISWPGGDGPRYEVLHPVTGEPCKIPEAGWRFAKKAEMERKIALGFVEFREDHTEPPFCKAHLKPIPEEDALTNSDSQEATENNDNVELATQVRGSYFYKQAQVAIKHLKKLMGAKLFDNPKDHIELARLIEYVFASEDSGIVLDFFSGSGTTAHSVLELNSNSDKNIRYVLVQLPQSCNPKERTGKAALKKGFSTIADIAKARIRNAIQEINGNDESVDVDAGFKVLKLDSTNIKPWEADFDNYEATLDDYISNIKPDRSEEDVLYEILLKYGLDLTLPIEERVIDGKKIFIVGFGALVLCLADDITLDAVEGIAALKQELKPEVMRVVFKDNGFSGPDGDVVKTNAVQTLRQHDITDVKSL